MSSSTAFRWHSKRLHENFGNFQSLFAECRLKGVHDSRVEVRSRSLNDSVPGFEGRQPLAIGPVANKGIVYVGHANDHGLDGYLLAFSGMISRAVKLVVVRENDR